ncbi:MAG: hypothetical protein K6E29_03510 [Cyanobacteria bacterium RUI128]|nr:hypothetical protein [Cyanobacteria bacterium RUI128]
MKICPVSSFGVINFTSQAQKQPEKSEQSSSGKEKFMKAMPYVAGAAVLAVSGYAFRSKIAKILKKNPELRNPVEHKEPPTLGTPLSDLREKVTEPPKVSEVSEIIKPVHEVPPVAQAEVSSEVEKTKEIFTHFDNEGKPVYEAVEMPSTEAGGRSIFTEMLESVNLNDETIMSKIDTIRTSEADNITRILNENTHGDWVDIPMMKKVANDYMNDTQRGETRFHQAADLLEQAHIKAHVKGDSKEMGGMFNLTDSFVTDPVLYRAYQNMPLEESAVRLNRLKEQELKSEVYKESMDAQGFFDKAFQRLSEKYQFKKYNEIRGIQW